MRNRSNSGVRLDYFQRLVSKTILKHQNPVTGLFPASETNPHSWVRDNVYAILSVWGLSKAYRKSADLDEDRAKAYELEQAVVKLMRGLLRCMLMQVDKLEKFKHTQNSKDALHAKYCSKTGKTVVGDLQWGHLQIDATSLYLLMLAQMTTAGLKIIYTLDEVDFIQNLVFYVETAYRTPDYGIWERGDKTNHGFPELNSSSVGMAKAALEAMNELDLFGARGGPQSVIHALPDEAQQCQAILHSMLPKESNSKEIDAALISVISFPAFAVDDKSKIEETRRKIQELLQGTYGFCRFLRDGYKTAREDPNRLHYEPWELQVFENIECEWPMFYAYFMLDGLFNGDVEQVNMYKDLLEDVLIKGEDGLPKVPELYRVPKDKVDLEKKNPGSQKREAIGKLPQMWGQSLFILARLIMENFISPGELDPLNRRLVSEPKPDIVVQVVILAEDLHVQSKLADFGVDVQTTQEVQPIQVYPASVLTKIYSLLGKNERLGLTGRPVSEIGILATSKLYTLQDQILAFIPQFLDQQQFYLTLDYEFTIDIFRTEVSYLKKSWKGLGRPTLIFIINRSQFGANMEPPPALVATLKKLQTGYIAGTRVHLGKLCEFLTTSCVTKLSFLTANPDLESQINKFLSGMYYGTTARPKLLSYEKKRGKQRKFRGRSTVSGIVKRTQSIQIDKDQVTALQAHLKKFDKSEQSTPDGSSSNPNSDPSSPSEDMEMSQPTQHLRPTHMHHEEQTCESPSGSPKLKHKSFFHSSLHSPEVNTTELIEQLNSTENLQEQVDIVCYLYIQNGLKYKVTLGDKSCTIKELLNELYEKAGTMKQWWLVRHTAGMLMKRVEDLALAATDLLVRQKQLAVGLPPDREKEITRPLPPDELATIIFDACGEDRGTASLTQEILVYLAMFIRTEPKLFREMLRLRVGLIVQVMAMELARTLKCSGDEASEHLMNLTPFELKTLLHHILSGKEFTVSSETSECGEYTHLSVKAKRKEEETTALARLSKSPNKSIPHMVVSNSTPDPSAEEEDSITDRQGQWLRRRRLDGALNRCPEDFYPRIWKFLHTYNCGLSIHGHHLAQGLTSEMTSGELKFALSVEKILNSIPQPEYRQLMVEALMVVTLISENDWKVDLRNAVHIDKVVQEANNLYLADQKIPYDQSVQMEGSAGICNHFYDSAPSGQYGTMSYLCRALARTLNIPTGPNDNVECVVS